MFRLLRNAGAAGAYVAFHTRRLNNLFFLLAVLVAIFIHSSGKWRTSSDLSGGPFHILILYRFLKPFSFNSALCFFSNAFLFLIFIYFDIRMSVESLSLHC